jgi:hypothetical protein
MRIRMEANNPSTDLTIMWTLWRVPTMWATKCSRTYKDQVKKCWILNWLQIKCRSKI